MPGERPYTRFDIDRPRYLGDQHWDSINTEFERLDRSLSANDHSEAIGNIKCLVEAVARVTHDINGVPAAPNAAFEKAVKGAHDLLFGQPGHEITYDSEFGNIATQASKMAAGLGKIRNEFGGGHGRARQPEMKAEMINLALDGGLLWVRWALRRLGLFAEGRPIPLIRALVEENATFRSGEIRRRLELAKLPSLDPKHQRSLGIAVGQRAMQGTFVVSSGGVTSCLESDDIVEIWTRDYRIGLAHGLLFSVDERPTIGSVSLGRALLAFDPLPDCGEEVEKLVELVIDSTRPGQVIRDAEKATEVVASIEERISVRPEGERDALKKLRQHIQPSLTDRRS